MKTIKLVGILIFALISSALSDTTDPVADYKQRFHLASENTLYKWSADMNGNGKNEVFLTSKDDWLEEVSHGSMPFWSVYLAKQDGSGYVLSTGESNDGGVGISPDSAFDTSKLYVGQITQLGKRGIVTMQVDTPKGKAAIATIYAYTVEGTHLKRTVLTTYDPDAGQNQIFNQYLSDSKRTKVQLQEVKP